MNILSLVFLLLSSSVFARLATRADWGQVVTNYQAKILVNADGTYQVDKTVEYEVLNEFGTKVVSDFKRRFNSGNTKIELLHAEVTNGDEVQKMPVDAQTITQLTNLKTAFDPIMEWKPNISHVKVGSKVILSYRTTVFKVPVPNYFAFNLFLSEEDDIIEKGQIDIESDLPLIVGGNNVESSFKIEQIKKKKDLIKITIVKPILNRLILEKYAVLPPKLAALVGVGTSKKWDAIQRSVESRFNIVMTSSFTPEMENVIEKAKSKMDFNEQLTVILTHLNQYFTIAGKMRTLNGQQAPRMFKEVYKSKMADDKELSAILAAILKKMGFKADVALVTQGNPQILHSRPEAVPSLDLFNQAVVKLEIKGETYWVDPILLPPFGLNHLPDISEGLALSMADNSGIERVGLDNPEPSVSKEVLKYTVDEAGDASVETQIKLEGLEGHMLLEEMAFNDQKTNEALLRQKIAGGQKVSHLEVKPLKNLELVATYKKAGVIQKDEKGRFFTVPYTRYYYENLFGNHKEWSGDVVTAGPHQFTRSLTYQNVHVVGEQRLKCSVKSAWFDLERRSVLLKNSFVITDDIVVKVAFISNKDIKSDAYQSAKGSLRACTKPEKIYIK